MIISAHIAYIFSVSFQCSGALLLLLSNFSPKRDSILKSFVQSTNLFLRNNNTKKYEYDKESFIDVFRHRFYNLISMIFLILGYLLGVFGQLDYQNKLCAVLQIFFVTFLFCTIPFYGMKLYAMRLKKHSHYFCITNDDVVRLKLKPSVENISNSEIDSIIDSI